MNYPGKELEVFDKATIFQKYIYFFTKKLLKDKVLEVGAGIGSFTRIYIDRCKNIYLTDLDEENCKTLKKKFIKNSNVKIDNKRINEINLNFDTIIYLNVLED